MKTYGNKINIQVELGVRKRSIPTSIKHIKSASDLNAYSYLNDVRQKLRVQSKSKDQNKMSESLKLSRSNPSIIPMGNNYIRMDMTRSGCFQQAVNKLHPSISQQANQFKNNPLERILDSKKKEAALIQKQAMDLIGKKPKFIRKKAQIKQQSIQSPLRSCGSFANLNESLRSVTELLQENNDLKKRITAYEAKIEELNNKIESLNPNVYKSKIRILQNSIRQYEMKLTTKEKQIQELSKKLESVEQQRNQAIKKCQELIAQQEIFKGNSCHFNIDDSAIGADMVSTAQYIESLTDLQQQLHHRKTQIFDLNKTVEQLKMKHHFAQLRNQQNARRIQQQWQTKYKKLYHMYKALKESRLTDSNTNNNRMKKLRTRTQYIEYSKQQLFDLSISTEQSQLQLY